jgi:hypothetical protein
MRLRLATNAAGEVRLTNGCAGSTLIGPYAPATPTHVIVRYSPPSAYWILVDGENDGFEDNLAVEGDVCNVGNLSHMNIYGWRTTPGDPVTVAVDNLIVDWLPLFVDGFEGGDTSLWSATAP